MARLAREPDPQIVGGTGKDRMERQIELAEMAQEGGAVGPTDTGGTDAQEQTIQELRSKLQAARTAKRAARSKIEEKKQTIRDLRQRLEEQKSGPTQEQRRQIAREAMRTLLTVLRDRGIL